MDGFTGFKTAAAEVPPDAAAVMDPFHVARSPGDALDLCRRRVQQGRYLHHGRKGGQLYNARCVLHTGADLHTEKQAARLWNCRRAVLTPRARQPVGSTTA